MNLKGKTILITGSARGLGRELVKQLSRDGAIVYATVRDARTSHAIQLKNDIASENVKLIQMDVTSDADVLRVASEIGELDVLINNAAVCCRGGVFRSPMDEMVAEFEINYFAPIRVVRGFLTALQKRQGLIVNIASQLVRTAMPALANYSASKSALVAASQAMRAELRHDGVSVCVVCPGGMKSDMSEPFPGEKQAIDSAAAEIIRAFEVVDGIVPIGEKAKALFELYKNDPVAAEQSKYDLTYEKFWGQE